VWPNKRLHPAPRRVPGVGHFVTLGCSVRSNQKRFQFISHFAARVSREALGGLIRGPRFTGSVPFLMGVR
jgi:hypothetical protein